MLIPAQPFNRTECSLDNQLWITLVRNDLSQFAIYQIVAFFKDNIYAIKISNLMWHFGIKSFASAVVSNGVIAISMQR